MSSPPRNEIGRFVPTVTSGDIALIRSMRYLDGLTAAQTAEIMGCSPESVLKYAPGRPGKVPVAPLREAFLASPMTAADVARSLEWWCRNKPDTSRVRRTLGIMVDMNGSGRLSYRTVTDAETVQRIAEAIGISPWAVLPDEDVAA